MDQLVSLVFLSLLYHSFSNDTSSFYEYTTLNGIDSSCEDIETSNGSCNQENVTISPGGNQENVTVSLPDTSIETSISTITGVTESITSENGIKSHVTISPRNFSQINDTGIMVNISSTEMTSTVKYIPLPRPDYCYCDLMKNECDMNCCCDDDCTVKDRTLFSSCLEADPEMSAHDYSYRYCYKTHFIYDNDKKVSRIIEKNSMGIFCIAVDNLPQNILYENISPIKSLEEFDKRWKRRKKGMIDWPHLHHTPADNVTINQQYPYNLTQYKFGDYIWTFTNYTEPSLRPLMLRVKSAVSITQESLSYIGRICNRDRPLLYLKDDSFSCLRKLPESKNECESQSYNLDANSFYDKNIRIVANHQPISNSSWFTEECSDEICIGIIASVCQNDSLLSCNEAPLRKSSFNEQTGICYNAVSRVRFIIKRNGTNGITAVNINFNLINLTRLPYKSRFFRQYFEIKHVDSQHNDRNYTIGRSGNPGYIPGKPIITGKKVNNKVSNPYIILDEDKKLWFGIHKSELNGYCSLNERLNLLFLENIKSNCLLRLPQNCDLARTKMLNILSGVYYSVNATEPNGINIYASIYGDPDPSDTDSWVPFLVRTIVDPLKKRSSFSFCDGIFTDIQLEILYSLAGTIRRPQAKIVGVLMTFGFNADAIIKVDRDSVTLQMIATASFIDVSKPDDTIIKFADPPVYEIKLPQDFFYPFLSSSKSTQPYLIVHIIALYTYLLITT